MTKRGTIKAIAIVIDVGAPLIATLTQFPIWVDRSAEATVSGLFLVFAILSAVPLFRYFKKFLRSPSAPIMWGLMLCFLLALRAIVDEMLIISAVGLVSNCVGWVLYRLAGRIKEGQKNPT